MTIAQPTLFEVQCILVEDLDHVRLGSFIEDAALLVERGVGRYEPARQKAIVKYVAAHLAQSAGLVEGTVVSDKLGDAARTYAKGTLGDRLAGTHYGQQALLLDIDGDLARLGAARASVEPLL